MILVHAVASLRDDLAIYGKESTKRMISLTAGFLGQFKRSAEQGIVDNAIEANQSRSPTASRVAASH
jgi:hypothetical protein